MSVIIFTNIQCDGASPVCMGSDWSADQQNLSAMQQRTNAKRDLGWRFRGGKDYCPKCWEWLKKEAIAP